MATKTSNSEQVTGNNVPPCFPPWFLFILVFTLTSPFLHAQSGDSLETNPDSLQSVNQVERTKEGFIIRQIISFPPLENILRYEIEIEERQEDGNLVSWVLAQEIETSVNSFEVSLAAGNYRYRYTAYNRMNLYQGRSNWQYFQLLQAIVPAPESYKPFYAMYYEMSGFGHTLTVYGNDFTDKTEFALVKQRRNFDWTGISLQGRKDMILPASKEVSENEAQLTFTRDSIKNGTYQIFVRNPGGLWVCFGEVRAGFYSGNDFLFEYGYSPGFYEKGFYDHNQVLRFGWFPVKTKIGSFGLGCHLYLGTGFNIDSGSINLLYQKAAGERFIHNVRLGFMSLSEYYWKEPVWDHVEGIGYIEIEPGYDVSGNYLYFNFGYSVQYFFWKNFYAAAGIDVLFCPVDYKKLTVLNALYINPFIGIGFQIGRWSDYAEVAQGIKRGEDYSLPVTGTPKGEHILSFGWLPMIPIYGIDLFGDRFVDYQLPPEYTSYYEQGYKYLNRFNPIGFNIKYAYLPYIYGNNKFGYDFEFAYLHHENILRPNGFMPFDRLLFGIRYQRVLNNSWNLNARAGIGIAKAYNFSEEYKIYNNGGIIMEDWFIKGGDSGLALNTGVSLQFFFLKNMFAEASLDFLFVFAEKTNIQLRPGVSFGWQFGRGGEKGLDLPGNGLPRLP